MNFEPMQAQTQIQTQVLAPALIKSIQLLSLPYLSLKTFLNQAILDNPFLEMDMLDGHTTVSIESMAESALSGRGSGSSPDELFVSYRNEMDSLHESLSIQLFYATSDRSLLAAGQCLIDSIDSRGYLSMPVSELAERSQIPESLARQALHLIQGFSPRGVGASNLKECLLLQIDPRTPEYAVVQKLFSASDDLLIRKDFSTLSAFCGISIPRLKKIFDYLKTLSPYPGEQFSFQEPIPFIYPEIEILPQNGQISCTIHSMTDLLKLSTDYYRKLSSACAGDPSAARYIQSKYKEAVELVSGLHLRCRAMEKLMLYLMNMQTDYFSSPSGRLRALTMRQAAKAIGMSDSTVSRCVNGRYVRTIHGVIPLKQIFSTGLPASGGGTVSSVEIKKIISSMIGSESAGRPVTDQQIAGQLNSQGIAISRRTVAKYRALMGIGSSSRRKGK